MTINRQDLLDPEVIADPYPFYTALRREAPVWNASPQNVFLVTSFDLLAEAARRIEDFSSVITAFLYRGEDGLLAKMEIELGTPTLATADPPVHTRHKQMIFPRFVSKRMAEIEDDLVAHTEACIDRSVEMGSFDFMTEIGYAVPIRAIAMLIGFAGRNDALLTQTALQLESVVSGTKTLEQMAQIQMDQREIETWLLEEIAAREGGETQHLLDAVKSAMDAGDFDEREALTTMMTLLSAGGGSTSALLGNCVRLLAENPDVRRALQADMDQLPAFIEEAGRIESPFRHHMRSVPKDTSLGGVDIPAGSTLMLMWGAANRDPAKFDNPDSLNYGRKLQHVFFGRGIHLCVGAALARMEARIVLRALLARDTFPRLSDDAMPQWEDSLMMRRHETLPMTWH